MKSLIRKHNFSSVMKGSCGCILFSYLLANMLWSALGDDPDEMTTTATIGEVKKKAVSCGPGTQNALYENSNSHSPVDDEVIRKMEKKYNFALVPKQINNRFFDVSKLGCEQSAKELSSEDGITVNCTYIGPEAEDASAQAKIIDQLISEQIDGIALSVIDAEVAAESISKAMAANIPVITFDSDASESDRLAYIGTDNDAFGMVLGKVLDQVAPEGGNYGIIATGAPNVMARVAGLRERLALTKWKEVEDSPTDCQDSTDLALELMWNYSKNPKIDAIIPVGGWPMFNTNQAPYKEFVDANKNMTLVVADALPVQLELMNMGYVNGLVGQLPYEMGHTAMKTLLKIKQGVEIEKQIFGTSLLEVMRIPLVLPELIVDENYIGGLAILGYILFSIIALLSIGFSVWTFVNRKKRVIRASQPVFLVMLCAGTLVFASTIIPLSIDDEHYGQQANDIACMSIPWLLGIGFTTVFSALFSKTWRINKILHNPSRFKRIKVTVKDVIKPYVVLMAINIILLSCWTAIRPLTFTRTPHPGTDDWNRVISEYGSCLIDAKGGSVNPFAILLGAVNVIVLIIANVQVYRARTIRTEFSESRYIGIIMASMLQACVISIPIVILVQTIPRAFFLVMTFMIFVTSMAVISFLFVPKVWYLKEMELERKRRLSKRQKAAEENGSAEANPSDRSEDHDTSTEASGLKIDVVQDANFQKKSFRRMVSFKKEDPKKTADLDDRETVPTDQTHTTSST